MNEGRRPGDAVRRAERTLATAGAVARAVTLVAWLAAHLAGAPDPARHPWWLVLVAVLAAESAALVAGLLRGGVVRRGWVLADAALLGVLLYLADLPAVSGAAPNVSPLYDFGVFAVVLFGLPRWPLPVAMGCTAPLVAANLGTVALAGPVPYPLWNAVPNSLTYVGSAAIAWTMGRLLRGSAAELDARRGAAVRRARQLAVERERARQGRALGARLLSTLEELSAAGGLDPVLAGQVTREVGWLREVVRDGLPAGTADLRAGLRALAEEKNATGLAVRLALPDELPTVTPERADALLGAAREALTNVGKHARTDRAEVTVTAAPGELLILVADAGRGYDPAARPAGTGQSRSIRDRMAGCGGGASIGSAPGHGTRVRLWAPAGDPVTNPPAEPRGERTPG